MNILFSILIITLAVGMWVMIFGVAYIAVQMFKLKFYTCFTTFAFLWFLVVLMAIGSTVEIVRHLTK